MAILLIALLISFVGSAHREPLAVVVDGDCGLGFQVRYYGGWLGTYVVIGAIAGAIGRGLDVVGGLGGIEQAALIVSGLVVIAYVVSRAVGRRRLAPTFGIGAIPRAMLNVVRSSPSPTTRTWMLGVTTALAPCGWLYAWVVTATATGNPYWGAATMAIFGLGAMLAMLAAQRFAPWLAIAKVGPMRVDGIACLRDTIASRSF